MAAAQKGSTAPEGPHGFGNEKLSDITTVFVSAPVTPSSVTGAFFCHTGSLKLPIMDSFHFPPLVSGQLTETSAGTPAGRWGTSTDGGH